MGKFGSVLVRLGSVLFVIGLVAVVVLFAMPKIDDGATAPLWVYLCTPLTPLGLVAAIAGVVMTGSARDDD